MFISASVLLLSWKAPSFWSHFRYYSRCATFRVFKLRFFTLRYVAGVTYFIECWSIHLLCTISTIPLLWRSLPFSHVFIYYVFSSYYVTVFSPCGFLPFSRPLVWVLLFSRFVFGFLCILVFFFVRISFRAYVRWFECIKICSALFSFTWCSHTDFITRLLLIRRRRIRSSWAIAHSDGRSSDEYADWIQWHECYVPQNSLPFPNRI